jgi:hypothetical protein
MNQNGRPHSLRTKRRSTLAIQKILENYQRSGLSQREFAAREQLSLSSLQWWLRQAKRKGDPQERPQWLEVNVPVPTTTLKQGLSYQIAMNGGVVSVPAGFDPKELKQLLDLMGTRS